MKQPVEKKLEIVGRFLRKEISIGRACHELGCTTRTFLNMRKKFLQEGVDGLKDHRGGNNRKLESGDITDIVRMKEQDVWRSSRNIRDKLKIQVHPKTIRRHIIAAGLGKVNIKRVKPLQTFEAEYPNAMWQTDIMGKMIFHRIGALYLIATLDDHSRFVPYGAWFASQHKAHVFHVWYQSLLTAGIPDTMLQDRGSQYKARTKIGETEYEYYAQKLNIKLIWAKHAQTKGKIERFWKFVQSDFVPEVLHLKSKQEVNERWQQWLHWYNHVYKSEYFENKTHASNWHPSKRKPDKHQMNELLTVWERRRVSTFNTVSLYGVWYKVPPGYTLCRVWLKIVGDTIYFQSMNRIFYKTKLRFK